MGNSRKKYEQKRDKIIANKKISEAEKSRLLFNNWQDYIFSSIPEEKKPIKTDVFLGEMIFVRL